MMIRSLIAAMFVAFALSGPFGIQAEEPKQLPLVFQDDFEKGADRWQPSDSKGWKVKQTDRGKVYSQFNKRADYKPPHRSPYNFSLIKDLTVGDFVLTTKVLSTHKDYGHRDVCLFFGYQDPGHFYYVHLGKKADDHANQIFIVNEKPRTKISLKTTKGTNWDDKWHNVKIVRSAKDGTIEIFYDDMKNPVMIAKDKTFTWGRIGIGSFDDTGDWDDIKLRGLKVKKPQ
ncbi:MAG: hypothetical protein IIA67_06315 [Planctomycetes bacterium]|nr:hypothetical protein [Planctomycetota bacterium]